MLARALLSVCITLAVVVPVFAQEGAAPTDNPNPPDQEADERKKREEEEKAKPKPVQTIDVVRASLEPAYLAYPIGLSGLDKLIFESNVIAHFVVNQPSWPFALVLTPKVVLRMFQGQSTPVKSPSYMPRITAYFWFDKEILDAPTVYGSVMLSHHSNGQAGSFFDDNGAIRHDGGSFSTNYFEFSAYATGFKGRWFGWSSLSFEWHPNFLQDNELHGRYGLFRLHVATTALANLPLKGTLHLRLSAILDKFLQTANGPILRAIERFPISARYTISIPGIDLGLYVGYYLGHDYYNIYFDRMIHTLQVGISGGVVPSLLNN